MLLSWNILRREMSWVCFWRKPDVLGKIVLDVGQKCESHGFCGWSIGVWACMCLTKSGENRKDCKGVAAQKDKREQNLWLRCNTCRQFCILFIQKLGDSGVAVGEVCSFGGMVLWEWGMQQYFGLSASVELQNWECPWEENRSSLIWTYTRSYQLFCCIFCEVPMDGADAF